MSKGADVNAKTSGGVNALMMACVGGYADAAAVAHLGEGRCPRHATIRAGPRSWLRRRAAVGQRWTRC